ncbi:MAG: phage tail assembly protein [Pseudomonadota bacterium]
MKEPVSPEPNTHILDTPIDRGETKIERLMLRKPKSGECRGLNLSDLGTGKVDALIKILPRIATPTITEQEAANLELCDLTELASIVVDFLFTTGRKADLPTT